MAHRIVSVDPGSPAARAGLRAGDELLSMNGEWVVDFLDYQALSAHRRVQLACRREGRLLSFTVRKDEYAPLGLNFALPMMSGIRACCNKCLFCFVDQLPAHVRDSMRVKDDDWRTSLMMGSYVTLTNVSDREIDRIIARHAAPLYISVHATDPELRSHLLGTPRGARLMPQLKRLSDGGITFHCQCVLCPGLNDGPALERTIAELTALEGALSLALVPVGLTGHRQGLTPLRKYTPEEARQVIAQADVWRERLLKERGTRFVFPSDEFYVQAGADIPPDEAYEDYGQIDDGVGLLRLLHTEYTQAWRELPEAERCAVGGVKATIACGESAAPYLRRLLEAYPVSGVEVRVVAVKNRFFGESVTVSGLITGGDLTEALKEDDGDVVLITVVMLRDGGDTFLDDMTLPEAQRRLGKPIIPVGRSGEELLEALRDLRTRGSDPR